MDTALRDILTAVREGRLDPSAAAELLAKAPTDDPSATAAPTATAAPDATGTVRAGERPSPSAWAGATDQLGPDTTTPGDAATSSSPHQPARPVPNAAPSRDDRATTALRVRALTRKVRIVGDPSVSTVSIDGPHELRREGTTLVCDVDHDLGLGDPFAFLPSGLGRFRVQPHGKPFSLGSELEIRVNPGIDLELDVTAGSLSVQGAGRVRAKITAGSARIEDSTGPLDLHVVGGTARVETIMVGSDNKIRCESGSIVVRLRPGSDVRVRAEAQLGRVMVDGVEGAKDVAIGGGHGRLRAEVVMGSIQVESGS